ncbi:hypothetical protein ACHQM5_018674 [Ranunculus cassubicifolius]
MAETSQSQPSIIQLNSDSEGTTNYTDEYIFQQIGSSLPLNPNSSTFDLSDPPSQALAISQNPNSPLIFIAHSSGFYVVRTKDAIEAAKLSKEKKERCCCIQELSVVDVRIGKVRILAVSKDSSTLAAVVGFDVYFYSTEALLNKEQEPSYLCSIDDASHVKDFKWRKKLKTSFIVLSSDGKLYHGKLKSPLKEVMENVDAVDWSAEGNFIAVAKENSIIICSSRFKEKFTLSMPFDSCSLEVDSINWIRQDCIALGCSQRKEDGYVIQLISSKEGNISEGSSKPVVLSFNEAFPCIDDEIVPSGHGPHLFLNYLEHREIALLANKKSTDDHIVLFNCSFDADQKEPALIAFSQDNYLPRIPIQENEDDNLIMGFGVDTTSLYEKVQVTLGIEQKELSPYCILLCLTLDEKLLMFYVAGFSSSGSMGFSAFSGSTPSVSESPSKSFGTELFSKDSRKPEAQKSAFPSSGSLGFGAFSGSTPSISESPSKSFGSELFSKDSRKPEAQKSAFSSSGSMVSSAVSGTTPSVLHSTSKGGNDGTSNVPPSNSQKEGFLNSSSGAHSSYKTLPTESSTSRPSSSIVNKVEQPSYRSQNPVNVTGANTSSVLPRSNILTSKDSNASSTFPSNASNHIGGLKSSTQNPVEPKLQPTVDKVRTAQSSYGMGSEREFSKHFGNVNEMSKELDNLLLQIEEEGGYRDTCIIFQRNSVLGIEQGLEDLSKRCRAWKGVMEDRLEGIQNLLDQTVQVLSKKIYIEGIVKQASDTQYWDLWNRQKLTPELELKRRQILKVNQTLTSQLIELERHFNTLELNKFGDSNEVLSARRGFHSGSKPSRDGQAFHRLYNTMSSQLAVAEQLSESLSKQMEVLNIESPSARRKSVTKELFESIGLSYEGDSFKSPNTKKSLRSPDSVKRFQLSSVSAATKEQSRRNSSSVVKTFEPETARRRVSLDRSWASFEPPKTTVKRMLLQEERPTVTATKSSLVTNKEGLKLSSPASYPKNRSHSEVDKGFSFNNVMINAKSETPAVATQEDEMEEEAPDMNLGGFGGFGLGSTPTTTSEAPKPNPFGGFLNTSPNPSPFNLSVPSGELFKPASFNIGQTFQHSQPATQSAFGSTFTPPEPTRSAFGQPAQIGVGQQALGSVLGSFGQSRQLGLSPPGAGFASTPGFGGGGGSGFGTPPSGGFAGAAASVGGFAKAASAGGGFAGVASSGGGGFAGVGSAGGGGGFGAFGNQQQGGGGLGGAASGGGGFGAFGNQQSGGGGFGGFGNQQGGGGFSAFGSAAGNPLLTQMRK